MCHCYLGILIHFRERLICLSQAQCCVKYRLRTMQPHLLGIGNERRRGREWQALWATQRHFCADSSRRKTGMCYWSPLAAHWGEAILAGSARVAQSWAAQAHLLTALAHLLLVLGIGGNMESCACEVRGHSVQVGASFLVSCRADWWVLHWYCPVQTQRGMWPLIGEKESCSVGS